MGFVEVVGRFFVEEIGDGDFEYFRDLGNCVYGDGYFSAFHFSVVPSGHSQLVGNVVLAKSAHRAKHANSLSNLLIHDSNFPRSEELTRS